EIRRARERVAAAGFARLIPAEVRPEIAVDEWVDAEEVEAAAGASGGGRGGARPRPGGDGGGPAGAPPRPPAGERVRPPGPPARRARRGSDESRARCPPPSPGRTRAARCHWRDRSIPRPPRRARCRGWRARAARGASAAGGRPGGRGTYSWSWLSSVSLVGACI